MGWIEQSLDKSEEFYKKFNKTADQNALAAPLRSTAPGWLFQGQEISCIPDVAHPWDLKVVRAIQEIDPDIVPIWVKYIYKEPADWGTNRTHIIGRHGLALVDKTPGTEINPFPCAMPGKRVLGSTPPNKIEHIFKGLDDSRASDLPGTYVPFNWEIYNFVRDNYRRLSLKQLKDHFINDPKARHDAKKAAEAAEADYKKSILQKYWQRKISEASDVETREYFLGIGQRKREPKKLYSK
jgi:hypothetical protein